MWVENIGGTTGYASPCACCTSWLGHWRKWTGSNRATCSAYGCRNDAEVGAHVRKTRSNDQQWYIAPLCRGCNRIPGEFEVSAALVHVGQCG